ncbi:nicotinamide/nicotinic acid mononucleotide adenylyltransferase 2 [Narcine bancroftii]|uniref:nicotinamide/nicotinic acid mononucleotide adenylyltransferase 2 n=1 Tax=Narcine bancroftii TaxID=1343680 RepID=UPI0038318F2C
MIQSTQKKHNKRFIKVLQHIQKIGLKLRREKCQFGVKEITFLGDKLSFEAGSQAKESELDKSKVKIREHIVVQQDVITLKRVQRRFRVLPASENFSYGERARDYLHKTGRYIVIGGIISPVHDSYGKQGLVSSRHRLTMCQLAVQSSDWIRVDPWECYQETWQTTCSVLEHHRDLMKRVTGCILSNVNSPATPVIGQPQNGRRTIYQNSTITNNKPTAVRILGKVGESLGKICCVRPHVERFTFVDENANLGTAMRYEEIELRILLLCGSDLLESFCIPGLWNEVDVEVIVGDFGIVVVPRDSVDTDRILNHSSLLRKYKDNILAVKDDINHPMSVVSSTKSRLALQHGDGHVVEYLSQPVIDYILQNQLYIKTSG